MFAPWILLPAATMGLLSMGMLNLKNMRDIENDARSGKKTIVVRIGSKAAAKYHVFLVSLAMLLSLVYSLSHFDSVWRLLFLVTVPFFIHDIIIVLRNSSPLALNDELKRLALSTFLFSVTFGLGLVL
jgi:1,4-dihydroxy-2-naphthoate polyprenyltransferase